jgi:hypothetical protein
MRFFPIILLLLVGCAAPLPVPPYEAPPPTPTEDLNSVDWLGPKPTPDDLEIYVSNFRRLAFGTEWNGSHPYVKKWDGPRICAPEKYHADTEQTLAKLRVATGVPFRVSLVPCDVLFADDPGKVGCGGRYRIDYSQARITIGRGTPTADCIEEELSQLTGLLNDIRYPHTLWNDENTGKVRGLAWHDAVMLRVLYHAELYQGMPEAEAMRIVPGLMRKVILEIQ